MIDSNYRDDVHQAIRAAQERGAHRFHDILLHCEGADPRLVREFLPDDDSASGVDGEPHTVRVAEARMHSHELAARFPAADPLSCQWWFTVDTVEKLATRMFQATQGLEERVAFIGAPTAGVQYSTRFGQAVVFEIDRDVVDAIEGPSRLDAIVYDVADELPPGHCAGYQAVLLDPPWYPGHIRSFLHRGIDLARPGASIYCSLPPRLTRPGIVAERQALLTELMKASVEIVALEPAATRYLVPEFEMHVFGDITGFEGWPWRAGDLLHIRKTQSTVFTADRLSKTAVRIYSRDPKRYRLFLREPLMADDPHAPDWVVVADGFRRTTSRRGLAVANLQWWTSDKRGGTFRQGARAEAAIKAWSSGCSRAQTVAILQEGGMVLAEANGLCEKLDQHLELWCTHAPPSVRGRPELSNHPGGSTLSSFATTVGRRLHGAKEDGYRAPFQRDRDRVVWSRGLRQLANKTQVFPIPSGDFLRHRLAHSLEVVQLASTIGASFGLDPYLIEAGGLAHDIGHTPFGHAGERALDQLLKEIGPLGGFNHYEHGVDIVRWLEDAYHSPSLGGIFGLNLTAEVAECIFKHMYGRGREEFGQTALYERSKHHDYFKDDSCHLEGQAVRIADKISYLVSDLEDGIRMGVFEEDDFLYCRLLRHPPLDLVPSDGESLHERFLSQRTILLKILMEDVIEATDCRLGAMAVASLDKIRSTHAYTVDHSAAMQTEVGEVWTLLQTGKLHKDARVKLANLRAERIVRDLTTLFAFAPELVDTRFREVHARLEGSPYMREYRERVGSSVQLAATLLRYIGTDERACKVPLRHLIQAKDYVASLPDTRASQLHAELLGSGAPWMP